MATNKKATYSKKDVDNAFFEGVRTVLTSDLGELHNICVSLDDTVKQELIAWLERTGSDGDLLEALKDMEH